MATTQSTNQTTILQAMMDKRLFAGTFGPKKKLFSTPVDSFAVWRVFLGALFGLSLSAEEHAIYRKHTGRGDNPTTQFSEGFLVCGRRSGKSLVSALIAVYLSVFRNYKPFLAPGETATVVVLASDKRQSRVIFKYVEALLKSSPLTRPLVEVVLKESIRLTNGVAIEVHVSDYRSIRGMTLAAAICDEVSFWKSESSSNPDSEVLAALRPALSTIPGSLLLCVSSPYARRGALFNAHRQFFGKEQNEVLVWQADSLSMNLTLPLRVVQSAYERDPASAKAEFGALFREDVESIFSEEMLEAVTIHGRRELPPHPEKEYVGFVDPSGGASDSFTMAIAHTEGEKVLLDLIREAKPPFSPEAIVREFSGILRAYRVHEVTGDSYAGVWPREQFAKHGINYRVSADNRSDLYLQLLPAITSHQVELLDNDKLRSQLTALERHTSRGGRDAINHPGGTHDDVANSVAGALSLLLEFSGGAFGLLDLMKAIDTGERRMPRSPDEVRVDNYRLQTPKPSKCPACNSTATIALGSPGNFHCNQCNADFASNGDVVARPVRIRVGIDCCDAPLRQVAGGEVRCGNCGQQTLREQPRGATHEYVESGRFIGSRFALRGPSTKRAPYQDVLDKFR